jgi:hypothetical protein
VASILGVPARLLPFLASASRERRRTGAALFAAHLVPVLGVAFLGWSFGEMLLVYLGESAILAALVPLKIAVITAHGPRTVRRVGLAVVEASAWSFFIYWTLYMFAVLIMGIAHMLELSRFRAADDDPTAHVLIVLTGAPDVYPTTTELLAHPLVHALLAFLAAELYSFAVHFIGEREHRHGAGKQMSQVGGRMAVLYLALVPGFFVLLLPLMLHFPAASAPAMTAVFMLCKIPVDLHAHEREHAALAAS